MKSDNINELAAALSKAQGAFDHAKKDVNNAFFKSKYADLASCIDAAKTALAANGLAVVQSTDVENDELVLITTLMHASGQWVDSKYPIRPVKNDPQGMGSAITYGRRYAFCAITGIAADDDDGNAASGKVTGNNIQQPVKPAPQNKPVSTGFEAQYLAMLEEAADYGISALTQSFKSIPNSADKSALWATYGKRLKERAASADEKLVAEGV